MIITLIIACVIVLFLILIYNSLVGKKKPGGHRFFQYRCAA